MSPTSASAANTSGASSAPNRSEPRVPRASNTAPTWRPIQPATSRHTENAAATCRRETPRSAAMGTERTVYA